MIAVYEFSAAEAAYIHKASTELLSRAVAPRFATPCSLTYDTTTTEATVTSLAAAAPALKVCVFAQPTMAAAAAESGGFVADAPVGDLMLLGQCELTADVFVAADSDAAAAAAVIDGGGKRSATFVVAMPLTLAPGTRSVEASNMTMRVRASVATSQPS
jgi:hypothetical protein